MSVDSFIANLRHAIRNNEPATVGGGVFLKDELTEVLELVEAGRRVLDASVAREAAIRAARVESQACDIATCTARWDELPGDAGSRCTECGRTCPF